MLPPADEKLWTREAAAHLLNRAGFGGTPDGIERLHAMGLTKAVDSLLEGADDSDRFPPPAWLEPAALMAETREFMDKRRGVQQMEEGEAQEMAKRRTQQAAQRRNRERTLELMGHWIHRMGSTTFPLREKMTLFWHGHFATSIEKVKQPALMARQNDLFRRHATGNFKSLTKAIVRDPAMMVYLDTNTSQRERPNENFARELMELFTLGEGHYSEDDIKQSARAFTGWRFRPFMREPRFLPFQHDGGEKSFFGESGRFSADDIVEIIFRQPACETFLLKKVWRFFVSDTLPDDALLAKLGTEFKAGGWELKPLLRSLFTSARFFEPQTMRAQIKSPVQFLVQMQRQLDLKSSVPDILLAGTLNQLGQVPFRPPNVAGWEGGKAWINTSTLLARYNIAGAFSTGSGDGLDGLPRPNAKPQMVRMRDRARQFAVRRLRPDWSALAPPELRREPAKLIDQLAWRFLNAPLSPADRAGLDSFVNEKAADGLSDDDIGHLVHLMMSTPRYQLC